MLSATCCAPASQHGSGLMLLPEKRSPSGNGRSNHPAVRRCILPMAGGGLAANRTIALAESCASVEKMVKLPRALIAERPSIWWRSAWCSPSSLSSLSSLIDEMGSGQMGEELPRKAVFGSVRRLRQAA